MGTGGLLLAVEADGAGAHPAAGRQSGASGAVLDPRFSRETVAVAEGAGFAFAVFGDGPVARALWDSWEDDAVVKDVATGRFLDNKKVHHIRFDGASFSVVGPLITPRPPQGQVVVIAGDSLGVADRAGITLVGGFSARTGHGRPAIAQRAERARQAGSPLVFVELEVTLDRPGEPADRRLARLNSSAPWHVTDRARSSGSAAALVEFLDGLSPHVDGVLFYLAETSVDLPLLADEVLTALTASGLARGPAPDAVTLRDVLGLPRPVNRFADQARAAEPAGATDSGRNTASA
jgi:hypothetical protein